MQNSTKRCEVEGCENHVTKRKYWCEKHYMRWYRHGDPHAVAPSGISYRRRYKSKYARGHPLAGLNNKAYEHRLVLYESIGPGIHACSWCRKEISWEDGTLVADHLNHVSDDNRLENLVPSCKTCNSNRGVAHWADIRRAAGWFSQNDTVRSCNSRKGATVK